MGHERRRTHPEFRLQCYITKNIMEKQRTKSLRLQPTNKTRYTDGFYCSSMENNCVWIRKVQFHPRVPAPLGRLSNTLTASTYFCMNGKKNAQSTKTTKLKYYLDWFHKYHSCQVRSQNIFETLLLRSQKSLPSNLTQVALEERPRGLCEASGDPHIRTPDGAMYHLFDIGQFLLWKSKAHRKFEVDSHMCEPSVALGQRL